MLQVTLTKGIQSLNTTFRLVGELLHSLSSFWFIEVLQTLNCITLFFSHCSPFNMNT